MMPVAHACGGRVIDAGPMAVGTADEKAVAVVEDFRSDAVVVEFAQQRSRW